MLATILDMVRRLVVIAAALCACAMAASGSDSLSSSVAGAATPDASTTPLVNAELPWHPAVLDPQGQLLAWYQPGQNLGYDHVLHLGWNFIEHRVAYEKGTKLRTYLVNSNFNGSTGQGAYWQSNPAMVFGSFVDSLVTWYPYSGDQQAVGTVGAMLHYEIAHGTTPSSWSWSGVPFATGCGGQPTYGRCLSDMPRSYYGGIEPDKVGELGIGDVRYYELTGDRATLVAGIHAADALAKHVQAGDDTHTPWPFRVDARTGATLDGEAFGGIVVSPLRLFDELIRIGQGDVRSYRRARSIAWRWLVTHQLDSASPAYDDWTGYFEDVPKAQSDLNQAAPTYTALYLLGLPHVSTSDPSWSSQVAHLISWVKQHFSAGTFDGATAINEQGPADGPAVCCSSAGLGSDTARWAAVNAEYYQKTGDLQALHDAVLSLDYATYFTDGSGRVSCCGNSLGTFQYWFSDGYSDYLRSFNWAMAAVPDLAPVGSDHLLGSTSVVQHVTYGRSRITYRTFDRDATDILRLTCRPTAVVAGGRSLHGGATSSGSGYTVRAALGGGFVVEVTHTNAHDVSITT